MFLNSVNDAEFFPEAIWNDGTADLEPKAVGDDGSKIVTSVAPEEDDEEE